MPPPVAGAARAVHLEGATLDTWGPAESSPEQKRWRECGEDLLSALPDDLLLLVLLRPPSSAAAAQTNLLSHRWRSLWTHLPELRFPRPADLVRSGAALAPPALRKLSVVTRDTDVGRAAALLLLAAPRLTNRLSFTLEEGGAVAAGGGAIELPCFEKAERITLRLGYLIGLALPPLDVFAKLTFLCFEQVKFHGPSKLGHVVSSARCPSLQVLRVIKSRGVSNLSIQSKTLHIICLHHVEGVKQLTIACPMLKSLDVVNCFRRRRPVASISAPVLETLSWYDAFDPRSVKLGQVAQLRELKSVGNVSHGFPKYREGWKPLMILQCFRKIPILHLYITYPSMLNIHHLTKVIALLPNIDV